MKITIVGRRVGVAGAANLGVIFNNDNSTNYARKNLIVNSNSTVATIGTGTSFIGGPASNNTGENFYFDLEFSNFTTGWHPGNVTASTDTETRFGSFNYQVIDQVTSVSFNSTGNGLAVLDSNTVIIARGHN